MDNLTITSTMTQLYENPTNNDNDNNILLSSNTNSQTDIILSEKLSNSNNNNINDDELIITHAVPSVREIIKKYEPNNSLLLNNGSQSQRSSIGSFRSFGRSKVNVAHSQSQTTQTFNNQNQQNQENQQNQSINNKNHLNNNYDSNYQCLSNEKVNNHILYEDEETTILNKQPVRKILSNRTVYRMNESSTRLSNSLQKLNNCRETIIEQHQLNSKEMIRNDLNTNLNTNKIKAPCTIFRVLAPPTPPPAPPSSSPPSSPPPAPPSSSISTKPIRLNKLSAHHRIENMANSHRSDKSYNSKTTITKTAHGVRIVTDLLFDKICDSNWHGSRIETDLPHSKIIKDFQAKNNS